MRNSGAEKEKVMKKRKAISKRIIATVLAVTMIASALIGTAASII